MLPSYETLELQLEEYVATVCLNRPDKANSMSAQLWEDLQSCFEWLDQEPSVRVVILAGNGKHFCAGLDLSMFAGLRGEPIEAGRRGEYLRRVVLRLQENLSALEKCRKPVLAAIHNTCIGGGVDLTCCADMRYATEDAFFSIREVDIGMAADVGTLQRLPKIIPPGVANELAYTGRNMGAEEARELGFVNRVYQDRETMLREVTEIARGIARKSPLAVRGTKEMLMYTRDHSVADGLNYVATWSAGMLSDADLQAGLLAQMEKKQAVYDD